VLAVAPFAPVDQDYLFEARQMQALSFAVHIPLVCFGTQGWRVDRFERAAPTRSLLVTKPESRQGAIRVNRTKGDEMKIVVIGGTGLIGSKLVEKLHRAGPEAVAASPDTGVNTITGDGLAEALEGAQVVVDVSNAPAMDDDAVLDFFQTSARNLLAAETAAGVNHHVVLSVVGADRLRESGYLRAKVAQEEAVKVGTVPYTIVRASQFFEFIRRLADSSFSGDAVQLAPVFVQPESADDVAGTLCDVALQEPVNGIVELAGPEQFRLDELARRVLRANKDERLVETDVHARYFGAELDEHSLTPGSNARIAPTRFENWLSQSMAG
jgi:uncharacterized protein YbjT (DUF2867 family)